MGDFFDLIRNFVDVDGDSGIISCVEWIKLFSKRHKINWKREFQRTTLILAIVASIICEDYMGHIPIRKRAIALWPAQYQRVSDSLISDKSKLNYQVNFQEMLKWKANCS